MNNNNTELESLRAIIERIADPAMALEDLKDAYADLEGESDALTAASTKGELMDVMQVRLRELLNVDEDPELEETN